MREGIWERGTVAIVLVAGFGRRKLERSGIQPDLVFEVVCMVFLLLELFDGREVE